MDEHYLYLVFSSTPYKVGKFIRGITRATYNHTSISLDRDLTQMFAFARRHCHTHLCMVALFTNLLPGITLTAMLPL